MWRQPYLLLVATTLMWGGNAVAARLSVGEMSPMVLTTLRWAIAIAALAMFAQRPIAAEWRSLLRHWPRILLMSGFGFTIFNALFYLAAETTTAINIGMIQGVMPALVMVGSFLAYRIPIRPVQVLGLVVAVAGVAAVVSRGDPAALLRAHFVIGDLWVLIACVFYSGYGVSLRGRPAASPLAFFAALALGALLTSLPLLAYEAAAGRAVWPGPKGWALILFIALCPSLIAQVFFMRGVELIGPGRAGLFINLVPVFAALLGVLVLREGFAPYHAAAMALVLGGIWLAERKPSGSTSSS